MKKLFTLVGAALVAMSVQAQDVYEAIQDGSLAPEFAAVAGEGGVATNAADGKSIVTITKGKATVTAVGGTTPANDEALGGAAQQIVPGAAVEGAGNRYEVASVGAWNDIKWGKGNQGDINFSYVTGTGNPYVKLYAKQNSTKEGELIEGSYSSDYVYYEPDGSLGLPITGLYYKFTATAKGAFKVKVWANKGNRLTFVVNEKDAKAQKLYASGYINGVNENGQKKFLSVEQVDSVHHVYIWGAYEAAVAAGEKTADELAEMKAAAEANEKKYEYVIGHGNQAFWGWLTFDVEADETYWVFQHSSQIGFGGFEYYEGGSAEELINDIEADYVYTTNFSTYTDSETGEQVAWKGEKVVGDGKFVHTDEEGAVFDYYFQNVAGTAPRQNYLLLPEDVLAHSAKTEALTIAVWVKAPQDVESSSYLWAPLFTAYGAGPATANTWPMLACQYRGVLQVNCAGWTDYTNAQNVAGANALYHGDTDWLADKNWHYYTAVFEGENAKVYFDGVVKNEWNNDGTTNTQKGLFSNGADLKYICLGGNQAWDWADNDAPFAFAKLLITNKALSANEIAAQMKLDAPNGTTVGIEAIQTVKVVDNSNAVYNLAGQRVAPGTKGLLIKNGKKYFVK